MDDLSISQPIGKEKLVRVIHKYTFEIAKLGIRALERANVKNFYI